MSKRWIALLPVLFSIFGCGGSSDSSGYVTIPGTTTGSQPILLSSRPSVAKGWSVGIVASAPLYSSRVVVVGDSLAPTPPGPTDNTFSDPYTIDLTSQTIVIPLKRGAGGHKLVAHLYGFSLSSHTYEYIGSSVNSDSASL